ncbi:choice-of-anchor D domain-containing protein [Persicimonas caeni]|uniref:Choice-of-anchor D domain-containing protein n=1 Tax=Persicimonas caeni TaxID=2292766 RepID=A0A4Y6PXX1_PERCE|nr:choice-of-anchor D domain-containing protein [Persicimonas caeni]QDG53174.1 choice-of-anchor D domain-containing protein [Persicimonas caeni]QED34396.1 choice-of-anchor D domain-containing protein [Persicimonas caeni]
MYRIAANPTSIWLSLLVALASATGCGDDAGTAELVTNSHTIVATDVDPASGPVTLEVLLENTGSAAARDLRASFLQEGASSAGSFSVVTDSLPSTVASGASATFEVTFTPSPNAPTGCDLLAKSTLDVRYRTSTGGSFVPLAVQVAVGGPCDEALRCSSVDFGNVPVGNTESAAVQCVNLAAAGGEEVSIGQASLAPDAPEAFELGSSSPALPATLAPMDWLEVQVTFAPAAREPYQTTLALTDDSTTIEQISVRGVGIGERPRCSDPRGDVPPPPEDVQNYRLELESTDIVSYGGIVQEVDGVNESYATLLRSAILTATGSFTHEGCIVSNNGASFRWEGAACTLEDGSTLINILTINGSDEAARQLGTVSAGDNIRVEGYEVRRIVDLSPGGGYWVDGGGGDIGQQTMYVTRVCDVEE